MNACAAAGRCDEALDLLDRLGPDADLVSCNTALKAARAARRFGSAQRLLREMPARGLQPDAVSRMLAYHRRLSLLPASFFLVLLFLFVR
jgi:pentatricopeptide repeat protein